MKRKLNRLTHYNYSLAGAYYITVCTHNKIVQFGDIKNDEMHLNDYGKIASNSWYEIVNYYDNVELEEFVVMPNHIHGIIFLHENNTVTEQCSVTTSTKNYGKLSKIIKSYKEAVTKQIQTQYNDLNFAWQRSFYNYIIRDENSLQKIREYTKYNPLKWSLDRNRLDNLEIAL